MGSQLYFSIHQQKFCLLRKERGQISFEQVGKHVKPLDIVLGKQAEIVTGLTSEEVILRHLTLKLKSKREIIAALPFQVENVLPYPAEELILLPALDMQKEQTEISLLASSKKALMSHLEKEGDSDIVSCIPLALFRYARHFYPDRESLFLQYENTFIVIENGKLCSFQTIRSGDAERVLALMQKKYPHIPSKPIERGEHWDFAIPVGLALDAAIADERSGQFRQNKNQSKEHQKKRKKQLIRFFSVCGCFICLTFAFGHLHLKKREHAVLEVLGYGQNMRLSTAVQELEESLYKQKKSTISLSTLPKISELLTWLSTDPKLQDCSITRLRYQLVKAPRLGTQIKTYSAKVELELTSQNPKAARSFHEALLRDHQIVDQKNDVRWNADHGIYRATFHIKPQKA
ncbi:MAG: hypothetical protein K1000chlam3_00927 [Chlamydiae bacterium]|nr:hypothetical protein [Chlamydiota bacterium]